MVELESYNMKTALVAKMLPVIAAIIAMVIFDVTPLRRILASPTSLGKTYYKEEKNSLY